MGTEGGGDTGTDGDGGSKALDGTGDGTGGEMGLDPVTFQVVTFNTGTSSVVAHDLDEKEGEGDGYTSVQAEWIDQYCGNSLAWKPAEEALREYLSEHKPEIVAFQEMMYDPWCEGAPEPPPGLGLVCEGYEPGDPLTIERLLGEGYQLASTEGQEDNWVGIRLDFGRFEGCPEEGLCEGGAKGLGLPGECNEKPRVSSIEVVLVGGERFVLVNVHTSAGMTEQDMECRAMQLDQVFKDQGDGKPAAWGGVNLVLGDFNTDPFMFAGADPSADRLSEYVGPGKPFQFISSDEEGGPPTHVTGFRIDHVVSDVITGSCQVAGESEGVPPVIESSFLDHRPLLCTVQLP